MITKHLNMILIKVFEQTVRFIITETYTVMSAMNICIVLVDVLVNSETV